MAHWNLPPTIRLLRSITNSNDHCKNSLCDRGRHFWECISLSYEHTLVIHYVYVCIPHANIYIYLYISGSHMIKISVKFNNSTMMQMYLTFPKWDRQSFLFWKISKVHKKSAVPTHFFCKIKPIMKLKMVQKAL